MRLVRDRMEIGKNPMAQSNRVKAKRELRERPAWYVPVKDDLLHEITRRIVDACQPERIILFGSHARGQPDWDSDLDLLVITRRNARQSVFERARQIYALFLDRATPMDILVRSPQELAHRLKIGDSFFQEIIARGRVLYARRNQHRVGSKSRNGLSRRARSRAAAQKSTA
jgi:predicted nucleotidyltransferase